MNDERLRSQFDNRNRYQVAEDCKVGDNSDIEMILSIIGLVTFIFSIGCCF